MSTYAGVSGPSSLGQSVGRIAISALVPAVGLLVLRLVLTSLPMIRNAGPMGDTALTPLVLIKAVIDTVIYVLIVRCALQIAETIQRLRPALAEAGTLVRLAGFAMVATLAYSGYEALFLSLVREEGNLYNWIFLALVLVPIVAIIFIVSRRLSYFNDIIFGQLFRKSAPGLVTGTPPGPPPPIGSNPDLQDRLKRAEEQAAAARGSAQQLRSQGSLTAELASAAANMDGYLLGAQEAQGRNDAVQAANYLDWAEYESGRVLAAKAAAR